MEAKSLGEEEISDEEWSLAGKLRSCCSPWGVERESKLPESASILLDMGKLYIHKAMKCDGMLQKFTFIKCAALICAANLRFDKIIGNSEKTAEASETFEEMSLKLLAACNTQIDNVHLLSISKMVATLLQQFREKEKMFIEQELVPFGDDIPQTELLLKQKEKIQKMQILLKQNTANYKSLMKYVSEECVKILGPAPCKFSLVGLGSLAREEITLYSDFEHVILLEDGIDDSPGGHNREYFRWYSVIFQVIVIGLGETYIPTVDVKSLNDLYSEDNSKQWYFDLWTPGGVSFDGRFPHSCKMPLGKQEASKNRKHVVELIQPIDKMLKYLLIQDDVKNGYHLRDVLIRTCLVHGSEDVYMEFKRRTSPIINRENRDIEVAEQTQSALIDINNEQMTNSGYFRDDMAFYKTKDFFYRPISVYVGCISRIYHMTIGSNLDFFSWFRQVIGKEVSELFETSIHNFEYAVAVACEIRLKIYSAAGHQRQKTSPKDVCKLVGKQCVLSCYRTILLTNALFRESEKKKMKFGDFLQRLLAGQLKSPALINAQLLLQFGFEEDAFRAHQTVPVEQGNDDLTEHTGTPASLYYEMGISMPNNREEYFNKAEEIILTSGDVEKLAFRDVCTRSMIYKDTARYNDCHELLRKWVDRYRESGSKTGKPDEYMIAQSLIARDLIKCMSPTEAVEYSSREIVESQDTVSQLAFRISLHCAQSRLGEMRLARKTLRDATEICRRDLKKIPLTLSLEYGRAIFYIQVMEQWKEDAALTFDLLDMMQGTKRQTEKTEEFLDLYKSLDSDSGSSAEEERLHRLKTFVHYLQRDPLSYTEMCDDALGNLLEGGISKFSQIAIYFKKARKQMLHHPMVYNNLHSSFQQYHSILINSSFYKVGHDLMVVLRTFRDHMNHPRFIGTIRDLTIGVVYKSASLQEATVSHAMMHASGSQDGITLTYNKALQNYAKLDIERSVTILWRIINCKKSKSSLLSKCCKFLVHMISIASFCQVPRFLIKHGPNFIARHSILPTDTTRENYNEAIKKYTNCDFQSSASSFWKIIINPDSDSTLRQKSIRTLMFVILTKWECDGYCIIVGDRFAFNEKEKTIEPFHVKFGLTFSTSKDQ